MKFSLKQRLLILIGFIVLVLLAVIVFIVIPSVKKIIELRQDITSIQTELEQRYVKPKSLKKSVVELKRIKEETAIYNDSILSEQDKLKLITEMEELAAKNQIDQTMDVNFFKGQKLTDHPFPNYYQFSFLNNTSFENNFDFLLELEKMPYYIIINKMQWEKKANKINTSTPDIILSFDGIIYATAK